MSDIILFASAGACSRVTMTALEQAGLDYRIQWVDILSGQTHSPEYLKINPKGKVPALSWDGRIMTENPALLQFIADRNPDAGVLPASEDSVDRAAYLADLCWCASTLHPTVRQIFRPQKWTTSAPEGVREDGHAKLAKESAAIVERVGDRWWHGDRWSIVDAYICWAYAVADRGGFSIPDYPVLADYLERAAAWPSYRKARANEGAAAQ